jgi:hypothetical protein
VTGTVHHFGDSLDLSAKYADAPWWDQVYLAAFPDLQGTVNMRGDSLAQRAGIDRRLVLSSTASIDVDEKVRAKDYDDFFLEYWSSRENRTPGWIAKPLACHYIAYAFIPSGRCYLLPFHPLRAAWKRHRTAWVDRYGRREVRNTNWTTVGCCVPIRTVLDAVSEAQLMRFTVEGQVAA